MRYAAAAALAVLATSCGTDLTESGEWVPWDAIEGPLRPEVSLGEYSGDAGNQTLRLVTFNVKFGDRIAHIADAFEKHPELSRGDVLLIQEIESYGEEGSSRAAFLAQRLRMNYAYAPSRIEGPDGTHGLAILSRLPLSGVEVMKLPKAETTIRPRQKIAMAASVGRGKHALRIINVHLDVRLNIAQRIRQVHPVVITAEHRVVLGGDFNTNPYLWLGSVPILSEHAVTDSDQAGMFDEYMRAYGFGTPTTASGVTQNSIVREFRLDSIYTRDLAAQGVGVAQEIDLSDHTPLWLDLAWPN